MVSAEHASALRRGRGWVRGAEARSAWGWAPSSGERRGGSCPGRSPCASPAALGCSPWAGFVMRLPQKLLPRIQDNLWGL